MKTLIIEDIESDFHKIFQMLILKTSVKALEISPFPFFLFSNINLGVSKSPVYFDNDFDYFSSFYEEINEENKDELIEKFLDLIEIETFDVIIIDMFLNGKKFGIDFYKKIISRKVDGKKIIVLSNTIPEVTAMYFREKEAYGSYHWVLKTANPSNCLRKIRRIINNLE